MRGACRPWCEGRGGCRGPGSLAARSRRAACTGSGGEGMKIERIGVIGGGAWGTALAQVAATGGREVRLWAREAEVVETINDAHTNPLFLPGIALSRSIRATGDLGDRKSVV